MDLLVAVVLIVEPLLHVLQELMRYLQIEFGVSQSQVGDVILVDIVEDKFVLIGITRARIPLDFLDDASSDLWEVPGDLRVLAENDLVGPGDEGVEKRHCIC